MAAYTASRKVALWLALSVTVTVSTAVAAVVGTLKVTPLNEPWVETAGEAGLVVTVVLPTFTEAMVLPAEKSLPVRYTVSPRAADAIGAPEVVALACASGLRVNGLLTITEPSVTKRVYEPCGRVAGRLQDTGPSPPLPSALSEQK